MAIARSSQEQSAGDNSTNYQAGQDIHVYGLTVDQAREVALDVFRSNAVELRGIAQAVAVSRAEELTNEFLESLERTMPERIDTLADPDMQSVIFEAQKDFARSGEADLKIALVDLLGARAREDERNLRTLALNEAIVSAPKLTESQRRAIAWVFFLRYTRDSGSSTIGSFFASLAAVVNALGVDIPTGHADYQHIEYVGAGSISLGNISFGKGVESGSEAFFTRGFAESDVVPELLTRLREKGLLIPALRDANHLQLQVLADEDLDKVLLQNDLVADTAAIQALLSIGRFSESEVADETVDQIPEIAPLRASWDEERSAVSVLTLTSVGIAIGHAYWSRLTGHSTPLSVWLP